MLRKPCAEPAKSAAAGGPSYLEKAPHLPRGVLARIEAAELGWPLSGDEETRLKKYLLGLTRLVRRRREEAEKQQGRTIVPEPPHTP